jgi:hypothetical protein
MTDLAGASPEVSQSEVLARFVLQSSHIRPSSQTVKPDAFIPHPYRELSVTRHLSMTEVELWSMAETVARETKKHLYGRADVGAAVCFHLQLVVRPAPVPGNPNHANIQGWPVDKPAQKIIAQEIAAVATFIAKR